MKIKTGRRMASRPAAITGDGQWGEKETMNAREAGELLPSLRTEATVRVLLAIRHPVHPLTPQRLLFL